MDRSYIRQENGVGFHQYGSGRLRFYTRKSSLDDRRRLRQYIQEKSIYIDRGIPCDLFSNKFMTEIRVPPVNSASDSIMVIADINLPIAYNEVIFTITFIAVTAVAAAQ